MGGGPQSNDEYPSEKAESTRISWCKDRTPRMSSSNYKAEERPGTEGTALLTPGLPDSKRMNVCCFKPPGLYRFVTAALGKQYKLLIKPGCWVCNELPWPAIFHTPSQLSGTIKRLRGDPTQSSSCESWCLVSPNFAPGAFLLCWLYFVTFYSNKL